MTPLGLALRVSAIIIGLACFALLLVIRHRQRSEFDAYFRNRASVTLLRVPLPSLDFLLLLLPVTLCTCGLIIAGLVGTASPLAPRPHKVAATGLAALLAAITLLTSPLFTRATVARLRSMVVKTLGEARSVACMVSAHAALLSIIAVSFLALHPSQLKPSTVCRDVERGGRPLPADDVQG